MGILDKALVKLDGYLLSIQRNTETSKYELEVGIPKSWVYNGNDLIDFEITHEADSGAIVHIFGKTEDVIIDDLIDFVNIIIDTNKKIADKEKEFNEMLKKAKETLETEVLEFQEKIEQMKKESFSNKKENEEEPTKIKRTPKSKINKIGDEKEEEKLSSL